VKRLAFVLAATGCFAPAPSTLQPDVSAEVSDGQLHTTVSLRGDPDISAEATFRGTTRELDHTTNGFYSAFFDLDGPVAADEPVTFVVDGVTMTVTAPTPLVVTAPLFVSRTNDATLTWTTPSAEAMPWYVYNSACVDGHGDIPPNATSVTLGAADWMAPSPQFPAVGTCTTVIRILRRHTGALDPAFAGGAIDFDELVDVSFASSP
jgi:hypothetical protein